MLASLPTASAQNVPMLVNSAFDFEDSDLKNLRDGRLPPGAPIILNFDVQVTAQFTGFCTSPVTVRYTAIGPAYATLIVSPSTDTKSIAWTTFGIQTPFTGMEGKAYFTTALTIQTKANAPALELGKYKIKVDATTGAAFGCNLSPASSESSELAIPNDYVPGLRVLSVTHDHHEVALKYENLANGPSRFRFSYETSDHGLVDSGWVQRLESKATHGSLALTVATWSFDDRAAPKDWTGRILIHQEFDGLIKNGSTQDELVTVPPDRGPS